MRQPRVELRLPFTLTVDLPVKSRMIETRIFSPGNGSFRVRSMAVRVRSDQAERDWFPYLTVGECGIHTGREVKSIENEVGCIAYTPSINVDMGHYELFLDIVDVIANDPKLSSKASIVIEIRSELEILAMQTCGSGVENRQQSCADIRCDTRRLHLELAYAVRSGDHADGGFNSRGESQKNVERDRAEALCPGAPSRGSGRPQDRAGDCRARGPRRKYRLYSTVIPRRAVRNNC